MLDNTANSRPGIVKKACKRCGRLFDYFGIGKMYCSKCAKIDSEQFQKVKDYIREVGPSDMFQIEEATGVDHKQVQVYLREGRLEIPANSELFIKCEKCGAKLRSGRFCPDCVHKMSAEFLSGTTFDSNEVGEPKVKVHYLNSEKKTGR